MSSLSTLEAPSAILAATEGIGLAALGLGKEAHIDLLYKSQVGQFADFKALSRLRPQHYPDEHRRVFESGRGEEG